MASSSSGVSATSPLGPAGSNSTMVLTSTTPGTGSVLSLPVGKYYSITVHACLCVCVSVCVCVVCVSVDLIYSDTAQLSHLNRSFRLQVEAHILCSLYNIVL